MCYLLMVSPLMEYECVACMGPTLSTSNINLRKVFKACSKMDFDYSYHSSVSSMLERPNWLPLILTAFKFHELATIAVRNLILMTPSILSIIVS